MMRSRGLSSSQVSDWHGSLTITIPSAPIRTLSGYTFQVPPTTGDFGGDYSTGWDVSSSVAGLFIGLQYYRQAAQVNTSHTIRLWSSPGQVLLGTVVTSGESGTGWKAALFGTPIAVTAGAYYRIVMECTVADHIFAASVPPGPIVTNGPLTLYTANGANPSYGPPNTYPNGVAGGSIWVDVLFQKS